MSESGNEIKSALEIAMEKADRIGSLSREEHKRLHEEKLASIGKTLAKQYLSGVPLRDIELELNKKDKGDLSTVTSYLVSGLVETLDIKVSDALDKILYAVQHFTQDIKVSQKVTELYGDYQVAVQKVREEQGNKLCASKRRELERIGITGSAVEPSFESTAEWSVIQQQMDKNYQDRLRELIKGWIKLIP